jgi:hypothetical protein
MSARADRAGACRLSGAALLTALSAPAAAPAQEAGAWDHRLTLYGWFTGLEGRITARASGADVEASASPRDVLDNLELAAMATAEARRGRLGLLLDGVYAALGSTQTPGAFPDLRISSDTDQLMLTAAAWRVREAGPGYIDVYSGLRYTDIDTETRVQGTGPLQGTGRLSGRADWIDPLIGLRAGTDLPSGSRSWPSPTLAASAPAPT